MQNVQLYLGIVVFFGGSLWLIVTIGRARYERLAVAQSATNLARAVDRGTHRAAHRSDTKPYSDRAAGNHRADTDSDGHGHADGGTK